MTSNQQTQNRSPWRRRVLAGLIVVLLVVAFLPWVVAKTGLRDRFLAWVVGNPMLSISTRDASFGYFSPFAINELKVSSASQSVDLQIEKICAEKSWLAMLTDLPQLGTVTFGQPRLQIVLDSNPQPPSGRSTGDVGSLLPVFKAIVERGEIRIRNRDDPDNLFELRDINLSVSMVRENECSVFVVDPITIFDHEALTTEICRQGLQLVAPLIADELSLDGSLSFCLDRVRVPIGPTAQDNKPELQITGSVTLHHLSVELKDDVTRRLVAMAAELFRAKVPDKLRVAENSVIEFYVAGDRIHHRGLGLVFPGSDSQISLESSGSVGWDESLDLEIIVSEKTVTGVAPTTTRLLVSGTVAEPKIESDAKN